MRLLEILIRIWRSPSLVKELSDIEPAWRNMMTEVDRKKLTSGDPLLKAIDSLANEIEDVIEAAKKLLGSAYRP